jgi:hypothetical protein
LGATCEKISEAYLLPVIRQLLEGFPFVILGFHADNGSEYINDQVATLLEKLRIEFTKSRPRHSNDNALAESKHGAVVRKHLWYAHIPQQFATQVNAFCAGFLNPYVNFHRPCFFPETITDARGKERKRYHYRDRKTPYEKLKSIPEARQYLKRGITVEHLDAIALRISDNEAALALNQARSTLFQTIAAAHRKQAWTKPARQHVHGSTRPSQNRRQRLRFTDRRSDSFPDWKRLPTMHCDETSAVGYSE